jgi:hypothetical protein
MTVQIVERYKAQYNNILQAHEVMGMMYKKKNYAAAQGRRG